MQALNYCRQFQVEAEKRIAGGLRPERVKVWRDAASECARATKYLLPPNGVVLEDAEFRALPDELPLTLPHDLIALEYEVDAPSLDRAKKVILLARQTGTDLVLRPLLFSAEGRWTAHETMTVPRVSPLVRQNGMPLIVVATPPDQNTYSPGMTSSVLHFLNALACLNVQTERLPRKKGKVKAALPFDEYHVLVLASRVSAAGTPLDGPRHGPREHVRRGHIRRLSAGAVWVNSTVVAAGRGGTIHKDYALRAGAGA